MSLTERCRRAAVQRAIAQERVAQTLEEGMARRYRRDEVQPLVDVAKRLGRRQARELARVEVAS